MSSVTINDVARFAGVSKKTVSRVINNEINVSVETRDKVMAVINQLGFKRNPLGMALAKNRSLFIALLADNPSPGYLQKLQKGILQCCSEEHMGLFLYDCRYRAPGLVNEIEEFIDNTLADGLILVPPLSDKQDLLDMLDRKKVCYMRIGPKNQGCGDSVGFNGVKAACEMTHYLLRLRHKDIAFVLGHPDQESSRRVETGFRKAFADQGLPVNEALIVQGYYTYQSGIDAAATLLSKSPRPTAILAANDEMAAGVLYEAHSRGIKVPDELSICGIDDISLTTKVWPNLTTMRQPIATIGYRAALMLINKLKGKPMPEAVTPEDQSNIYDCELIVRDSTCAPSNLRT